MRPFWGEILRPWCHQGRHFTARRMRFYKDEAILGWDFTATMPFWGEILQWQGHSGVDFLTFLLDPGLGRLYLQPLLDVFSRDIHFKRKHTIRHLSFTQNFLIYLYFYLLYTLICKIWNSVILMSYIRILLFFRIHQFLLVWENFLLKVCKTLK